MASELKRAAIYARISQSDLGVPKIADQVKNLQRLARSEGYEVVRTFSDDGVSAYSGKLRPAFVTMVGDLEMGAFDFILATANDRLSRNDEESYLLRSKCTEHGVRWHTLANGITDPSTAQGSLMAKITSSIAEYESAIKSERVRRSVSDRLERGLDLGGRRAFGFDGRRRPTINEAEAEVIRAGVAMIRAGATVYAVTEAWNKTSARPPGGAERWRTQTVRSILLRPRNVGRLVVKGVDYGVQLPAIVSEEDYAEVVAILNDPARRPRRGPVPLTWTALRVVRCGVCGGRLESTGFGKGRLAARCADRAPGDRRRHPMMLLSALEDQVAESVLARVLVRNAEGKSFEVGRAEVAALRLRLADLEKQRDREQLLGRMEGANLNIVAVTLVDLGKQIAAVKASIDAALAADASAAAMEIARQFVVKHPGVTTIQGDRARRPWAKLWSATSVEQRRDLVRALFTSIELMPASRETTWRLRVDGGDADDGGFWHFLRSLGWLVKVTVIQDATRAVDRAS